MYHASQHHISEDHNFDSHLCIFVCQESYNEAGVEKTFIWLLKCSRSAARKELFHQIMKQSYEVFSDDIRVTDGLV